MPEALDKSSARPCGTIQCKGGSFFRYGGEYHSGTHPCFPLSEGDLGIVCVTWGMSVSSKVSSLGGYATASLWHDRLEAWHESAPGLKRRILCHSSTGMMVLYRIAPGTVFPLHNHPHAQFGAFLEGGGTLKVGGETWTMKEGDSYYVPPGITHELTTNPNKETVLVDFFTPDREDYAKEALQPDNQ